MAAPDPNAASRSACLRMLRFLGVALVLAELAGRAGLIASMLDGGVAALLALPFVAPALVGATAAQAMLRPRRGELLATAAAALAAFPFLLGAAAGVPNAPLVAAMAAAGCASLLVLGACAVQLALQKKRGGPGAAEVLDVLLPSLVLVAFVVLSGPMVHLTAALWPTTWDERLYVVDAAFGLPLSFAIGQATAAVPGLGDLCLAVYVGLPLALMLVHAARRRAGTEGADLMVSFVALTAVGYLGYHLVPVAGPVYAFPGLFPASPPDPASLAALRSAVQPMPRNCMPSLHTAWALLVWWNARPLGRAWRGAAAAFFAITLLATVGLGFHYVVDLVAAWPLAMAVEAWGARRLAGGAAPAHRMAAAAAVAGLATTAAWMTFVAWSPWAPALPPGLLWLLAASIVGGSTVARRRVLATAAAEQTAAADLLEREQDAWSAARSFALAATALGGVGAAVLIRIVAESTAPVFGHHGAVRTAIAVCTLLGAALGASAVSALPMQPSFRDRLAIGLAAALAAASWASLAAVEAALGAMAASGFAQSAAYVAVPALAGLLAAGLGGAGLVGLAAQRFRDVGRGLPSAACSFLAGASAGALASTYLAIPSLWSRPLPSMAFACAALLAGAAASLGAGAEETRATDSGALPAPVRMPAAAFALAGGLLLAFAVAVQGRTVEALLGATAYAQGQRAASVLAGLALGLSASIAAAAGAGTSNATTGRNPNAAAAGGSGRNAAPVALLAASLAVALSSALWNGAPAYFASFAAYVDGHSLMRLFSQREALRFVVAALFLVPLTAAAGATLHAMTRAAAAATGKPLAQAGNGDEAAGAAALAAAAAMMIGAAGGFALAHAAMNVFPAARLLDTAALALAALGVAAAGPVRMAVLVPAATAVVVALASGGPDPTMLASASSLTFAADSGATLAFDDADGVVALRSVAGGARELVVDGHTRERGAAGPAPGLALVRRHERALLLGSAGRLAEAEIASARFHEVQRTEVRPAVIAANADEAASGPRALPSDGTPTAPRAVPVAAAAPSAGAAPVASAPRAALASVPPGLDYVRVAAVHPAEAAAGPLSTREFYALAAARLREGGVLEQHLPLERVSAIAMASMLGAARKSFPDLRVVPGADEAVLLACAGTCGGAAAAGDGAAVLDAAAVDRLLASVAGHLQVPVEAIGATDRDLFLAFHAPTAFAPDSSGAADARSLLAAFSPSAAAAGREEGAP